MMMIDATDREILRQLQRNARVANAEIARRIEMAPSAVLERIRKLEEKGIIEGYTARVNARAVGAGLTAFIFVRADEPIGAVETADRIGAIPGVQEVHHVAGEDCFLVKLRVRDTEALGRLLREDLGSLESVRSTRTTIVLETVKESSMVEITGEEAASDE